MSDELDRLRAELADAYANLTAVQERCNALLEEARRLRQMLSDPLGLHLQ